MEGRDCEADPTLDIIFDYFVLFLKYHCSGHISHCCFMMFESYAILD